MDTTYALQGVLRPPMYAYWPDTSPSTLGLIAVLLIAAIFCLRHGQSHIEGAPPFAPGAFPIVGSLQYYTEQADFIARSTAALRRKSFSFHIGWFHVVGVTGEKYRKAFFENRGFSLSRGYMSLIVGLPQAKQDANPFTEFHLARDDGFPGYFQKRLFALMKKPQMEKLLPHMLRDARQHFDRIAQAPQGITQPFEEIYRAVFTFTIRAVACNDVADSPELTEKILELFEWLDDSDSPMAVVFPWFPSPAKLKKLYIGARLYGIFDGIKRTRIAENRREDDSLQYLMDHGDSTINIVSFILTSLFAGQIATGVMASWTVVELATHPHWLSKVREEVINVADRHAPGDLPLGDKVMQIPLSAWQNEFPTIGLCLKEVIRLQLVGTVIRKNVSDKPIAMDAQGETLVPPGAYCTMSVNDILRCPSTYREPATFDPARYLPGREEDKNAVHGHFGFGAGLHPCLGASFAKMETNILVAFSVAYFSEVQIVDEAGRATDRVPAWNRNDRHVPRPKEPCFMKFQLREV